MNKIYLIGDSTCQTNNEDTFPQTGWGQVIGQYLKEEFEVINLAKNGRSSKSFFNEGLFKPCEMNIDKGDYLFIQFGHNDEKDDIERHTDPYTTYQEYLRYYIKCAKEHEAIPVLLSSIYRRKFDDNGNLEENCHLQYPNAMEDLANKEKVIYIDLCQKTKELLTQLGVIKSRELFMNFDANKYINYPEGKNDNTHLRPIGAKCICELLIHEMAKYKELECLIKK